jgi:fimbrial isopeptide formation D2 family protein/uncharacterized repeat protein (TIGR01451 family)
VTVPNFIIDIEKTVDDTTVILGQTLTYTVNYSNPSSLSDLTGVVITDVLEPQLDYVDQSCSDGCSYDAGTRTLTWNIGNLAALANGQVTFQASVNDVSVNSIPNTAVIDSNEVGPEESTVVVTPVEFDITIEKTASQYLFEIDPSNPELTTWTYFIDYSNQSPEELTGVVVTDTLPSEVTYVDGSCSDNCIFDSGAGTLTWNIGNLASQASGQVEFQVTLNAGETYVHEQYINNPAEITSDQVGPEQDDVDVQIVFFELVFDKTVDATLVQPNQVVTYTINYEIPSTVGELTSVVITDQLTDTRVQYVDASCQTCSYDPATRTLTWNLGTLTAGTIGNVQYQVQVIEDPQEGTVDNIAVIESNELPPQEDIETITIPETDLPETGGAALSILTVIALLVAIGYLFRRAYTQGVSLEF